MLVREIRNLSRLGQQLSRFSTMGATITTEETYTPKKFPLTTPVGQMRRAVREMPHKDFGFFYKQKLRLSLRELDVIFPSNLGIRKCICLWIN